MLAGSTRSRPWKIATANTASRLIGATSSSFLLRQMACAPEGLSHNSPPPGEFRVTPSVMRRPIFFGQREKQHLPLVRLTGTDKVRCERRTNSFIRQNA